MPIQVLLMQILNSLVWRSATAGAGMQIPNIGDLDTTYFDGDCETIGRAWVQERN